MTQILIQGLLLSGLYALIAVGFTLIFSVGRVLNLAYGAYLMLGGYAFFWVSQTLGAPKLIGVLAAGAQAETLRVQLDLAVIRAPFDGVITERRVDEGAIAAPGQPVLQLQ